MTALQRRILTMLTLGVVVGLAAAGLRADEPDPELLEDLLDRLQQLDFDDADAVFQAADWARSHGLSDYAAKLYHRALDADPRHTDAHRRLRDIARRDGVAEDTELRQQLTDEFPDFHLHASDHFLVVHDTGAEAARRRARLLERTRETFYRTFDRAGLKPRPLHERLVVILFAEREDFEQYARDVDAVHRDWSLGHYSARTNRIVFFHEPSGSALERYTQRVDDQRAQVRMLEDELRRARRDGNRAGARHVERELRSARAELNRLRARRTRLADATDTARTTHEATHQLAFNAGVLRRGVAYPLWIVEGMAASFEAPRDAAAFGPHADNPHRRAALIDARRRGDLMPIDKLATRVDPPDDARAVRDLYAQSWALFRLLFRRHPEQLHAYLAELYTLPRGEHDPVALRDAFTDAFGDVDTLQRRFDAYVRSLN